MLYPNTAKSKPR